jgi:hypothetical protein
MNDVVVVRRFEGLGNLPRDRKRLVHGNRPLRDPVRQRRPLDKLHHKSRRPVRPLETVDRCDVGMIQRGKDFGFALEPSQALCTGRERIRKHFNGHGPLQVRVGSPIDFTHAARTNLGSDFIGAEPRARG